eukprot:9328702-Lingulodinium_polyedra.AAC.1
MPDGMPHGRHEGLAADEREGRRVAGHAGLDEAIRGVEEDHAGPLQDHPRLHFRAGAKGLLGDA